MPTVPDPHTAVLLMAHGSRRANANADLADLARRVREQGGYAIVEVSYLELAEPSIPQGGRNCVARGATRVRMLPYFLSAGRHVTEDLQAFQRQLATEFPAVAFDLCPPLGLHPLMTQIVLDRLQEADQSSDCRSRDLQAVIEHLQSFRQRPAMYLGVVTVQSAVAYLHGLRFACGLNRLIGSTTHSSDIAQERGWDAGSLHFSHALIQRGLSVTDAVDELVSIEIEAFERSAKNLRTPS